MQDYGSQPYTLYSLYHTMNTLEAFIFSNECVTAQAIANVWNRLHGTQVTAAQVEAIASELNRKVYSFSF